MSNGYADTPMSARTGGTAARAVELPRTGPAAEAMAATPAACNSRRRLKEEDILYPFDGGGSAYVQVGTCGGQVCARPGGRAAAGPAADPPVAVRRR
ncbi:hypothetical protein GCM10027168_45700 [Streptomyces capparidis]